MPSRVPSQQWNIEQFKYIYIMEWKGCGRVGVTGHVYEQWHLWEAQLVLWGWVAGAERVKAAPARMGGGGRQLVGAGLGTGHQALLHPPPLGLLDPPVAEQLLCSGCQHSLWKPSPRSSRGFCSADLGKASQRRLCNCTFQGGVRAIFIKEPQPQAPRPLRYGTAIGLLAPKEVREELSRRLIMLTGWWSTQNRRGFQKQETLTKKALRPLLTQRVGFIVTNRTLRTSLLGRELDLAHHRSPPEPAEETGERTQSPATSLECWLCHLLTAWPLERWPWNLTLALGFSRTEMGVNITSISKAVLGAWVRCVIGLDWGTLLLLMKRK